MSGRDRHQGTPSRGSSASAPSRPRIASPRRSWRGGQNVPLERFTRGIGFEYVHVANDDEHPSTMGLAAAQEALAEAGLKGEDLDLVIFVSGGDYDYRNWCPSTSIVRELGCHHAYSFEIRNGCAGGVLACNVAAGMMDRDPSVNNALVVCADTLSRIVSAEIPECQPPLYFRDMINRVYLKEYVSVINRAVERCGQS